MKERNYIRSKTYKTFYKCKLSDDVISLAINAYLVFSAVLVILTPLS
jgi:hypothetical protein